MMRRLAEIFVYGDDPLSRSVGLINARTKRVLCDKLYQDLKSSEARRQKHKYNK